MAQRAAPDDLFALSEAFWEDVRRAAGPDADEREEFEKTLAQIEARRPIPLNFGCFAEFCAVWGSDPAKEALARVRQRRALASQPVPPAAMAEPPAGAAEAPPPLLREPRGGGPPPAALVVPSSAREPDEMERRGQGGAPPESDEESGTCMEEDEEDEDEESDGGRAAFLERVNKVMNVRRMEQLLDTPVGHIPLEDRRVVRAFAAYRTVSGRTRGLKEDAFFEHLEEGDLLGSSSNVPVTHNDYMRALLKVTVLRDSVADLLAALSRLEKRWWPQD